VEEDHSQNRRVTARAISKAQREPDTLGHEPKIIISKSTKIVARESFFVGRVETASVSVFGPGKNNISHSINQASLLV